MTNKLLQEIKNEPTGKAGRKPIVLQMLKSLSEQDRKDLVEAINDPLISGRSIAKVLQKRGIEISEATVYRYRSTGVLNDIA
jgi:DNA-directed RNA polymerase specialized sigma54-like protein